MKEKGIRYVTAFRDNTNYINAAKKGIGIFEMGESLTAQDREEETSNILGETKKRKNNFLGQTILYALPDIFKFNDVWKYCVISDVSKILDSFIKDSLFCHRICLLFHSQ